MRVDANEEEEEEELISIRLKVTQTAIQFVVEKLFQEF